MNKKIIFLNASPRKDKNTATLLKEVQRGAEEAGADVQYINLIDLSFSGCRSCFACKRTGNKCGGICVLKDDLRPVLEKITEADALVIGSPIYWHNTTGMFRNFIERLLFPILRYDFDPETGGIGRYLRKRMPTALIYTMNVTPEYYEKFNYHTILEPVRSQLEAFFGYCEQLNAQNTWQFYPDYSKYDAKAVDLKEKQWYRDNQWPKDMLAAYELGKRLIEMVSGK